MQELDDKSLLKRYVEQSSEEAFAAIVSRHINKVYSTALRHTRNPAQAEEITQAVFAILTKEAHRLSRRVVLSGWLYQTARLTSVTFLRSEIRRTRREQEAHMQSIANERTDDEIWKQIAPMLDVAMAGLNKTDRHAILLRFFDGKSMREVGAAIGATEDTAKKRVSRALEKLRNCFAKRGVHSTTAIIAGALSSNSVQAAPAALAQSVTATAISKGVTAGGSTLTLVKGALKVMAWTKAKTALATGVLILLAAGTTTVTVNAISHFRADNIFDRFNHRRNISMQMLNAAPAIVAIQPAEGSWKGAGMEANGKLLGLGQSMQQMLAAAYGTTRSRVTAETPLAPGRFDYISTLRNGPAEALQREIRKKFGLVGRRETRDTDVFVLRAPNRSSPGLRQSSRQFSTMSWDTNGVRMVGQPMQVIAGILEDNLGTPVIDQTGLTGNFSLQLKWRNFNPGQPVDQNAFRQAVLDQLGLELVPAVQPVEMLVAERAR